MTDVTTFFKNPERRSKRAKAVKYAQARAEVIERSGGRCEAAVEGVCRGMGTNAHHRQLAGQGGPDTPENLLWVCGSGTTGCHGWIHANPQQAIWLGLLVSSFDPAPGLINVERVK